VLYVFAVVGALMTAAGFMWLVSGRPPDKLARSNTHPRFAIGVLLLGVSIIVSSAVEISAEGDERNRAVTTAVSLIGTLGVILLFTSRQRRG
jgi:hypothetical protein